MKIKTANAARLLARLSQWRKELPPVGEMTEAQIKRLAIYSISAVTVLGLTVFSVADGAAATTDPGAAEVNSTNIFNVSEGFSLASIFDQAQVRLGLLDFSSCLAGDNISVDGAEVSYGSIYGDFYDASNVDPNAVCVITIDGKKVVYMADKASAQAVLDGIIARYTSQGSEVTSINFAEKVEIIEADDYVTAEMAAKDKTIMETYLCQVDEAVNYILNGCSEPKTYTVQGGDTMWDIAKKNGVSVSELTAMNPSLNADRLTIGTVLNLYERHPFVNVNTTELATEVITIPYTTSYSQSADLYKGQTKVTSAGSNGSKERVVEYVRQNGVIVSSNVISETVTAEPVTQYAVVGTTTMPIKTGSGSLISPVGSTQVSSAAGQFGASRSGGRRRHAGVDLKGNCGDTIVASDGGTVTFAGWSSSYGYVVKIDHGNGIETRYAHCNSMLVSYGDNVEKGQAIATVGKTGNATGYLCHFEVRVNGTAVNPLNYI